MQDPLDQDLPVDCHAIFYAKVFQVMSTLGSHASWGRVFGDTLGALLTLQQQPRAAGKGMRRKLLTAKFNAPSSPRMMRAPHPQGVPQGGGDWRWAGYGHRRPRRYRLLG